MGTGGDIGGANSYNGTGILIAGFVIWLLIVIAIWFFKDN